MNQKKKRIINSEIISSVESISAISLNDEERDKILPYLEDLRFNYQEMRGFKYKNSLKPPLYFNPTLDSYTEKKIPQKIHLSMLKSISLPEKEDDIAFLSIVQLATLLQRGEITSLELTELYLNRLKHYNPKLECVITLTEELAFEQAEKADKEQLKGKNRGLLHGIPYGIKDLFAFPGYPTTWGAEPFKNQMINQKATVIKKLEIAGAVLLAKLSSGRLASDHNWFGGSTKSPWNIEHHAGGSSAGCAAATAAGLVGFSIGTETWGSIIQPCHQCGTTGFRPTYGRVSTYGVMTLSWSLDKVGPICRTVDDCAIVFDAIYGPDGKDHSIQNIPFYWHKNNGIKEIRIGFTKDLFQMQYENKLYDLETLKLLKNKGFKLKPVRLPNISTYIIYIITTCEMSNLFEELFLNKVDVEPWTNSLKVARFIPAIEYIKAQRHRSILMNKMKNIFNTVDVIITPTIDYTNDFWKTSSNYLTNLTGHPAVIIPNGFKENGMPSSITFIGDVYKEEKLLSIAKFCQDNTIFHLVKPDLMKLNKD